MKILTKLLDHVYASTYQIAQKVFGKRVGVGEHLAGRANIFWLMTLIALPFVWTAIRIFKLPVEFSLYFIGLLFLILILLYERKQKYVKDEDEDERFVRFLKLNIWCRLPFYFLACIFLLFILVSVLFFLYAVLNVMYS